MKKKKTILIFDFDGTIADSLDTIVATGNELGSVFGVPTISKEEFRRVGIKNLLKKYRVSSMKLAVFLWLTKRRLRTKMADIPLVSGIKEVLRDLSQEGFRLGVFTSNTKKNVEVFLKKNHLENVFDFVYSENNFFGKDKAMHRLLKKYSLKKEDITYVGDECRDINAMKNAGVAMIAVSWGFESRRVLESADAEMIADTPEELAELLRKRFL
jgi:phosphoglycolate phosphatase